MALSPEQITLNTARLTEAETALHQLLIGGQPVRVQDQSGESVTYSSANVSRLRTYISELKLILAGGSTGVVSAPFRPLFT